MHALDIVRTRDVTNTSLTDQDIGSSVIKCFTEHSDVIREGAEADDCKLSDCIYKKDGRTGGTKTFRAKSIKT